jgi:hypothetical protein
VTCKVGQCEANPNNCFKNLAAPWDAPKSVWLKQNESIALMAASRDCQYEPNDRQTNSWPARQRGDRAIAIRQEIQVVLKFAF